MGNWGFQLLDKNVPSNGETQVPDKSEVAVIGAGPYGLSIAAHLRAKGLTCRTFGSPMGVWRTRMPKGMFLKSEGFASNLYDPSSRFTLSRFSSDRRLPYADVGEPVALDTFVSYGLAFQEQFVPDLEDRSVLNISRRTADFALDLADGGSVTAKKVIVAVGISYFDYMPPILNNLPEELVTHASRHHALDKFNGKRVVVVGSGASAIDIAALLRQAGADVEIVARKSKIAFQNPPEPRRWIRDRLQYPQSGIGYGWKFRFCTDLPLAFHYLPEKHRMDIVRLYLGPAPGWFVRSEVENKVPMHLGINLETVAAKNDHVTVSLRCSDGSTRTLEADHVIAGTGYQVDLDRLPFLPPQLRSQIQVAGGSPVLSVNFESSVGGLYFTGLASAVSFGPVTRFAFGARFTARRLARVIAARRH
jgi:cation diffusion facilitator CzcD-associated flavoprotein CzcO